MGAHSRIVAAKGIRSLFEEYERLKEAYGWRGNPYRLAVEVHSLLDVLSGLPVDPSTYEEKVRKMVERGRDEGEILRFVEEVRNRAAGIEREVPREVLDALHSGLFESIEELRDALDEFRKEAEQVSPRASLSCVAERGRGKVSLLVENPAPLPLEVVVELEGAVPLKPLHRFVVQPRSSASWSGSALVGGQRVLAKVTYRFPWPGVQGVTTAEAVVEVSRRLSYLNEPVASLAELEEIRGLPLRSTVSPLIGGWALRAYLGEGGFYRVFLAEREGVRTALKVPKVACEVSGAGELVQGVVFREGGSVRRLVEEEARVLEGVKRVREEEGLRHLIDFYGWGVSEVRGAGGTVEVPYLALQFCPRGNLVRVAGRLSIHDALRAVLQAGAALQRCYEKNVLIKHGDLKPENLLVDEVGRVVVTDFQTALRERVTKGAMQGTPGYYALVPDERADVYALGRVLVDLVAGLDTPVERAPTEVRGLVLAAQDLRMRMREFVEEAERILHRLA
jgi:hypothetical protein